MQAARARYFATFLVDQIRKTIDSLARIQIIASNYPSLVSRQILRFLPTNWLASFYPPNPPAWLPKIINSLYTKIQFDKACALFDNHQFEQAAINFRRCLKTSYDPQHYFV